MNTFFAEVNARCQRGMRTRYTMQEIPESIADDVPALFEAPPRRCAETWGTVTAHRLLLPCGFELEFGHRPGCVAPLLRFSSTDYQGAAARSTVTPAWTAAVLVKAA